MNEFDPASLLVKIQIVSGGAGIALAFFQLMRFGKTYPLLRPLTYAAFILAVAGVAFGEYYAGRAPGRLKPIEATRPLAAIAGYTDAIRLNPGNSDLYFRRGRTDFNLKRYPDAVIDFTKALELSPGEPEYLASRGMAFLFMGKINSAEEDINLAIKGGYQDPEVKMAQGMLSESRGRYPEAIAEYTDALAHDLVQINRCSALLNRGVVYMLEEDYLSARKDFAQAIAACEGGSQESAFVDRGNANKAIGDYEAALSDWQAALSLDPNDPVIFRDRAEMNRDLGRLDSAISDYSRYLELRPDDAYSFIVRSEIYKQTGDLKNAEADRRTADDLIKTNRARVYPSHLGPLGVVEPAPKA